MEKMTRQLISIMLILAMVFVGMANGSSKQVQAAVNQEKLSSSSLNSFEKILYLGGQGAKTYDFDIKKESRYAGAVYYWYVKTDKGNPDAVTINKNTGVVTACEAGTAYIRCKITLTNGTVLRPEARVTVRNNITKVGINNLPENLTLPVGMSFDFNREVLDTDAGKGVKTQGITRWEIADNIAGVETVTIQGVVLPVKEGKFKIRAICFQSTAKYKLWLADKEANETCITAASEWATINVVTKNGATASTQEQLNKFLKEETITQVTVTTEEAIEFIIPKGDYSNKSLIVNAANADVNNYGIFKEITINAIKDSTWIEFADGNIFYLSDEVVSFIVDKDVIVKKIVIDTLDSITNIEIQGKVEQIIVLQPAEVNFTGNAKQVPVSVEPTAGGSTITTSLPLNLEMKAKTDITLNQGSENTILDKSASEVVVKIENNTNKDSTITTNNGAVEAIGVGKTVISGGTPTGAQNPIIVPPPIIVPSPIIEGDIRTITGYFTNNDGTDLALFRTATVPYGTMETTAKAPLSTVGFAKLSDNSYVAIKIAWTFDVQPYVATVVGTKAVTGTVSGTFAGGQTPVNQTGTVTVSADTRTITGYFTNNDGADIALVRIATVPYGTTETTAKEPLSTVGFAKLSDNSYVAITIAWTFDVQPYVGTTVGAKAVTGTVSGTFAGGQTPVNQTGTVTVSTDTRTITGYYLNTSNDALVKAATVAYGTNEATAKEGLSTAGFAKLSDNSYVPVTIAWAFDVQPYVGTTAGAKAVTGIVSGTFAGGQTPVNQTGTVTISADTRTITGYFTDNDGTDIGLERTAAVPYGTMETTANAPLSTVGFAKLSDDSYVPITIAWSFDTQPYVGTTAGTKAVTGIVSGTFAGGQTPVNQTGTVTVSADTRTITGYYINASEPALVITATVPFGTNEVTAKAGLSTAGVAKLSDNSYVPITIAWSFDTQPYVGTTAGTKVVTGTVSGTFAGGQTPVNQTGTVSVSADTRTITGYFTDNDGTDIAIVGAATVPYGTMETSANAPLSTVGFAKLSDNSYVAITIDWTFDVQPYVATTVGAKAVTGTVSGTFAGGQTPVNQTGTVTVSADTRTITGYYINSSGTVLVKIAIVAFGVNEATAKAGLSTAGVAKLSDNSYVPITIAWSFDTQPYNGTTPGTKAVTGTVTGTFVGGQTPVNQTGTVYVNTDTRTIIGYYLNTSDGVLVNAATVAYETTEATAKAGLSTTGFAKLSDNSYVPITIAWSFDTQPYVGTTAGTKAVTGTVSGTFAGGQTPVNQTGTVTVSADTRTIIGYYLNTSDGALVKAATVAYETTEAAAKAGLSTIGVAKLSDNSYVPITIAWSFDTQPYVGTTAGVKTVTGTVTGTFVGGQTPVNQTGTVTMSADTKTITGYYLNTSDGALVKAATVAYETTEATAKAGLSTIGVAKLSDNSYVPITIAWSFDTQPYVGTTAGTKAVTGTVTGTFAGGQTPVNQTGTVTVSADTRTITGYYLNTSDGALVYAATVAYETTEANAKSGLSTIGVAKLSDNSYVPITITWSFDTQPYVGTTAGTKAVTGTVTGTFAGGQTPVNQTGTVTVSADETKPTVTALVQSSTNAAGQTVSVQSNEATGAVYIILSGETQGTVADFGTAVIAKKGATGAIVSANTDVTLSTAGMVAGTYYAYAVDAAGNVSVKGMNAITIANEPTANIVLALTSPAPNSNNTIVLDGTKDYNVNVEFDTGLVVFTGTKTSAQTVIVAGTDSENVTVTGSVTAPTYILDTFDIMLGGQKSFQLIVQEVGKSYIVQNVTVIVQPLVIGQRYGGGIVAYITQDGSGTPHGFIAATEDQGVGIWSDFSIGVTAQGTAIGTGQSNTSAIVGEPDMNSGAAAVVCDSLVLNGYDDWYLPSKDELDMLYTNLANTSEKMNANGFVNDAYWTSTEESDGYGCIQNFSNGVQTRSVYNSPMIHIRAIRSF